MCAVATHGHACFVFCVCFTPAERFGVLCFVFRVLCFVFCVLRFVFPHVVWRLCLAGLFFWSKLLSSCGAFELPLTMQLCDGDASAIGIDGSFKFRCVESTPSPNKHVVSGNYKGLTAATPSKPVMRAKPKSKSGNTKPTPANGVASKCNGGVIATRAKSVIQKKAKSKASPKKRTAKVKTAKPVGAGLCFVFFVGVCVCACVYVSVCVGSKI